MNFDSAVPVAFLYVSDRKQALGFYCDILGLVLKISDNFGDFIENGGSLVRMTVMPDHKAGPHPVLGWKVADVHATARSLLDNGIQLTIYDGIGQDALGVWTSPEDGTKVAWFADPDGNVLSLNSA